MQGFDAVLVAVKHVFASLFNDRAISIACIRVMTTAAWRYPPGYKGWCVPTSPHPASCSPLIPSPALTVVFITSARGLGEMVVQGAVNPDEFYVHKPTLAAGRPSIVRRTMGSKRSA